MKNLSILNAPKPIESLKINADLNGVAGINRNLGQGLLIDANNDLDALACWLVEFEDSPDTHRAYRKEIERLLLWCLITKNKPFSSLNKNDLREFQDFLQEPSPENVWCGSRKPRTSPDWKPFVKGLSPSSIHQAMTIIGAAFSYLSDAGYLIGNPVKLIRRKTKNVSDDNKVERFLEKKDWLYVVDFIGELPEETKKQARIKNRIVFLFNFLYLLGPRVSEVSCLKMNSFRLVRGKWWCYILGKGSKLAKVPVNDSLLGALACYREFLDLNALPSSDEEKSLILNLTGKTGISENMIYRIVKDVFQQVANKVLDRDINSYHRLKQASTHWMRHTSITHQADLGLDIRFIMKSARHNDIKTTQRYMHAEEDNWHDAHQALK